jgi:hypothetical protein
VSATYLHQNHQSPVTHHEAQRLASANEIHNLDAVIAVNKGVGKELSLEDREVVLDSNTARIDRQLRQQIGNRNRFVEFVGFSVERDAHWTVATWMIKPTVRRADSQGKPLIQSGLRRVRDSDRRRR